MGCKERVARGSTAATRPEQRSGSKRWTPSVPLSAHLSRSLGPEIRAKAPPPVSKPAAVSPPGDEAALARFNNRLKSFLFSDFSPSF